MHVEERCDRGGDTIGWLLDDGRGNRIWCGELQRAEFLALPSQQREALRDDLGWYLVEIAGRDGSGRAVLARVSDESSGLRLARAFLLGRAADNAVSHSLLATA